MIYTLGDDDEEMREKVGIQSTSIWIIYAHLMSKKFILGSTAIIVMYNFWSQEPKTFPVILNKIDPTVVIYKTLL
jgi:hypothetical protein